METALKIEIVTRPVLSGVERWFRAGTFFWYFCHSGTASLSSLSLSFIVSFLILTPLLPSTGSACLAVSAFPSSRNRSSFDHWSNPPQSRSCPSHNLSPVAGPDLGDSNQCQDNWLSQSQMSRANTNTSLRTVSWVCWCAGLHDDYQSWLSYVTQSEDDNRPNEVNDTPPVIMGPSYGHNILYVFSSQSNVFLSESLGG